MKENKLPKSRRRMVTLHRTESIYCKLCVESFYETLYNNQSTVNSNKYMHTRVKNPGSEVIQEISLGEIYMA